MKSHLHIPDKGAACGTKSSRFYPFMEWRIMESKCLRCFEAALRMGLYRGNNDYTPTQSEGSLQNGNYECKGGNSEWV